MILALLSVKPKNSTKHFFALNIRPMAKKRRRKSHPGKKHKKKFRPGSKSGHYKERKSKHNFAQKDPAKFAKLTLSETQKDHLAKLLSGIGVPEPKPFVPDDFQTAALKAIETKDVLVTAPTGSGKTWIAREEIRRLLADNKRAWYTTPLKALTNSKYAEFGEEFGAENVGILTGDRKENADAPLIVGTTEIYRNQLFDALRHGEQVNTDFVIIDEAHYLADDYRGHVWEEAIILSPPRIRLLLLSATIGNAGEFAAWIEEVRGTEVQIINRVGSRPVELRAAFLAPNAQLFPLVNEDGKYNRTINQFAKKDETRRYYRRRRR